MSFPLVQLCFQGSPPQLHCLPWRAPDTFAKLLDLLGGGRLAFTSRAQHQEQLGLCRCGVTRDPRGEDKGQETWGLVTWGCGGHVCLKIKILKKHILH